MSTYKKIFEKSQAILDVSARKSEAWFLDQIKLLKSQRVSPYYVMRGSADRDRPYALIGNLYFFGYNAKWKDKLPYWDQFPLTMPFSIHTNGFTGLNFHYLPYGTRAYLLDELLKINNQKIDETTRLKLSWEKIVAVSRIADLAKIAVHRYLNSHVLTPFRMVEPMDWKAALLLPVGKFTSSTKKKVPEHTIWSQQNG